MTPSDDVQTPRPSDSFDSLDPAKQTFAFMDALLGYAPADLHALLWTLQGKRSTWVGLSDDDGPQRVADAARGLADGGKDVYVAVSLAGAAGGPDTRIKSANAAGIFGLWADIDIADPDVHKKWNLPPSIDAAMELLEATSVPPSVIVDSGHGLQAWWLFKEFWAFDSEDDRLAAAGLAQRWNTTLQVYAGERQWVVDSTFDLARVMRVPGTLNRKGQPVKPVRLLSADGPRYDASDIEPFCRDQRVLAARGITPTSEYIPDPIDLSETLAPDFERFQSLLDNDTLFEQTWKMKRKDLSSPSEYDMSLCVQVGRVGWSDTEMAALMLAFRRQHKLDTAKALRQDYVRRTIARAREFIARDNTSEALAEASEEMAEAERSGDPDRKREARRVALGVIGQRLGLTILHFIKYLSEPPTFALVLPTVTIYLGGADGILRWDKFKQSLWQSEGHQIDRMKAHEWDEITKMIPKAWEEQDIGAEATDAGEVAAWLNAYLAQRPPVDTLEEAATSEYPFVGEDGRVVMFGPAFKRWLWLTYQERLTNKEMGRRLRAFGADPDKVNFESADGKRSTRGVWLLPTHVNS